MTTPITLPKFVITLDDIDYYPVFRHKSDGRLHKYKEDRFQANADGAVMVAAGRDIMTMEDLLNAISLAQTAAVARVLVVGAFIAGIVAEDFRDAMVWDTSGAYRVHHTLADMKQMAGEL